MTAPPKSLAEAVGRIHEESRGLLSVHVIRRDDMLRMVAAAIGGNADAAHLLIQANSLLARIAAAPADAAPECGCCGTALANGRYALVIATPEITDPEAGLGLAICWQCGTSMGAIKAAALKALRGFWPDGRYVTIHDGAGHG